MHKVDESVTLSYAQQELYEEKSRNEVLRGIVWELSKCMNDEQFFHMLKRVFPEKIVFVKDGAINVGLVSFEIDRFSSCPTAE